MTAPADARDEGTIAYGILDDDGGVYTVRPDGTRSRKILIDALWPTLSPSSRRVAYVREHRGVNGGLWVAKADGSRRRRIVNSQRRAVQGHTDYQAWQPSWSSDGARIAFGALRVLAEGGSPAWSPRGDLIAYTTDLGGTDTDNWNRIAIIRPDGTKRAFVLNDRRAWRTELDFSPNGRRLLYREEDFAHGHSRLCVLDLRTRRITKLKSERVEDAAWAPSGRRIAYLQNPATPTGQRAAPSEVRSIRPDGSSDRLLFALPFDVRNGRWATTLSWRR